MKEKIAYACLALALVSALVYTLMGLGTMPVGDQSPGEALPAFFYVIPGGYVLGGILVLLKRRWLWITGACINGFAIAVFYAMYAARPDIMFSAPGLIIKIAQVLLEAGLVYLIVTFRRQPAPQIT